MADMDAATQAHGLAVPQTRRHTGVSGLTWRRHGWLTRNIASAWYLLSPK